MSALFKKKYTVDEYLQMELTASYKSEYYNGEIFPMGEIEGETPEDMAGALPAHNKIQSNLVFAFESTLRNSECSTFGSDQRIFVPKRAYILTPTSQSFVAHRSTRIA